MRYMVMHKMTPSMEAGEPPTPEMMERMGAFIGEASASGVLLAADGLGSTKRNTSRVTVSGGRKTVVDGPFAETKELIAGFAIIKVDSHAEAVEWAKKFADVHGGDLEVDVRKVMEMEDLEGLA